MKLNTSLLVGLFSLLSASAEAQSPSTTQVGILKTANPYAVSILLNQTWYPMGSVNTSLNLWTLPVAQVVSGTTPILAATNTWSGIQTFSSPIHVGSSNPIAITNLGALASYNFNLPTSAGSANAPLLSGGGGASAMTWGTRSGITTKFATVSGSFTVGNCVNTDANGDFHDAGAPCGSGGGGGSGTVISGNLGELAYYPANGTTVDGNPNVTVSAGTLTLGVSGGVSGSLALSGSVSGASVLNAPTSGGGTLTLPAGTDTLVGQASTATLTNKTFDTAGTGNVFRINGTAVNSVTGTGAAVLATSPTLVTPNLGTPSAATLTNATGLPVSTGLAGAGTGVTAALGTAVNTTGGLVTSAVTSLPNVTTLRNMSVPSATDTIVGKATTDTFTNKTFDTAGTGNSFSINGTAITAVTGTGSAVLATSPTLVTPNLGTPSAATLTNATGLPVSTGLAGTGTGVTTALGNAVNGAGGFITSAATSLPSLATVGTITSGVWNGTAVAVGYGGTGITSGASGGIPYFNTTSTMATSPSLTQFGVVYGGGIGGAPGTTTTGVGNTILKSNGGLSAPQFATLSSVMDTAFSSTQGSILYRDSTGWAALTPGSAGQVLASGGGAANPSWATVSGSGTVTSVAFSAGTTGFSVTGSPITTAGTITLGGTLAIANGGTGQTTANAGLNALLPSQTGQATKVLTTDGANTSWQPSGSGTVTSVGVSGGTTGLTVTGSPVTTSGTITLGGTLALANGGTGATTQSGALTNILPSQTAQSGKVLGTNGTTASWVTAGTGTVTSVDVAGGTTGLTFTGGPVTTSGTITAGGTLALANGGTGATTQAGAATNILPSQTGNSGKFLTTNGSATSWSAAGTGTVTSVAFSTGTTGLSVSGSPITTSGTLQLAGVLNAANGGTGAATAAANTLFGVAGPSAAQPGFNTVTSVFDNAFSTSRGSLLYRGVSAWQPLASSATANTVLINNGSSTDPSWGTVTGPIDALGVAGAAGTPGTGSILYKGAGGWTSLAAGTSGQFLKSNGAAAPSWAAASGGGGSYTPGVDAVGICGVVEGTGATPSTNTTALNNCLTTYKAVSLRPGTYLVNACINIPQNGTLTGAGQYATYIKMATGSTTTSTVCMTSQSNLTNLSIDRQTVTETAAAGTCGVSMGSGSFETIQNVDSWNAYDGFCIKGGSTYGILMNSNALNNYHDGFYFGMTSIAALQMIIQNNYAGFNNASGFHAYTTLDGMALWGPWAQNSSFANGDYGVFLEAAGSGNYNDIALVDQLSSSNCNDGLRIQALGGQNVIKGGLYEFAGTGTTSYTSGAGCGRNSSGSPFGSGTAFKAATNSGNGINVISTKASTSDLFLSNVLVDLNNTHSVLLNAPAVYTFTGNSISNAGYKVTSANHYGIAFAAGSAGSILHATNNSIGSPYFKTQDIGIAVLANISGSITDNNFAPTGSIGVAGGTAISSGASTFVVTGNTIGASQACSFSGTTLKGATGTGMAWNIGPGTGCP